MPMALYVTVEQKAAPADLLSDHEEEEHEHDRRDLAGNS
jgi:hypothetical protein